MSLVPGISAFLRDGDTIYHTYSTFARGIDLAAGGPELRFHDEYGPEDGA